MIADLLEREFVFVAGKGGVGRTTVSAAVAHLAASRGKRVLVTMCTVKERLSHLMGCEPIGEEITTIAPNIDAVNTNSEAARGEYGRMILKIGAVYRAIFENRYVMSFLRGTPGIESWSLLGKTYFHVIERQAGEPRYDLVIFDGPATGHALDMLRTPRALREMVPPGLMRREADKAWELFTDQERSACVLVSLPEDMPVNETIELHDTFVDELGLPIGGIVLNRCHEDIFDDGEESWLAAEHAHAGPELLSLLTRGRRRAAREALQVDAEERLRASTGARLVTLPQLYRSGFARAEVEELSASLAAQGI